MASTRCESATLLDGFEKNEVLGGYHTRVLPLPTEDAARDRFLAFADEATCWLGTPVQLEADGPRRMAASGRGVLVRISMTGFHRWWHASDTWDGDPLAEVYEWLGEEGSF